MPEEKPGMGSYLTFSKQLECPLSLVVPGSLSAEDGDRREATRGYFMLSVTTSLFSILYNFVFLP